MAHSVHFKWEADVSNSDAGVDALVTSLDG